jgi:hypothetical protein
LTFWLCDAALETAGEAPAATPDSRKVLIQPVAAAMLEIVMESCDALDPVNGLTVELSS